MSFLPHPMWNLIPCPCSHSHSHSLLWLVQHIPSGAFVLKAIVLGPTTPVPPTILFPSEQNPNSYGDIQGKPRIWPYVFFFFFVCLFYFLFSFLYISQTELLIVPNISVFLLLSFSYDASPRSENHPPSQYVYILEVWIKSYFSDGMSLTPLIKEKTFFLELLLVSQHTSVCVCVFIFLVDHKLFWAFMTCDLHIQ